MTDIVDRLRSGEDGLEYAAADEIEELRKAIHLAIEAIDADDVISAVERLIAALGENSHD